MSRPSGDIAQDTESLKALTTVVNALKDLDPEQQRRVLRTAETFLNQGKPTLRGA